jgi:hypothetical protein
MKKLFYLLMVLLGVASSAPAQSLPSHPDRAEKHLGALDRHSSTASPHNLVRGRSRSQKVIGTELAYSAQSFRWKDVRAKNPTATTRTLTAQQFHDENSGAGSNSSQVTLAQLGITTDHVLEIKISHPDASITGATSEIPGDTLLSKEKKHDYFFRLQYTLRSETARRHPQMIYGEKS